MSGAPRLPDTNVVLRCFTRADEPTILQVLTLLQRVEQPQFGGMH